MGGDGALAVVLVHGAWHGGWCWSALQTALDMRGVPSYAIDLPWRGLSSQRSNGLHGDVEALHQSIDRLAQPLVLVAHSYGGAVAGVTAGRDERVAAVVYVAAFALTAGESVNSFLQEAPRHRVSVRELIVQTTEGTTVLDPLRASTIYTGITAGEAAAHAARLCPQPMGTLSGPATGDPFGRVPTTYVLCDRDDVVHPEHQRIMAARCDQQIALDSGHFPMLEMPGQLADIVAPIARTAPRS